MTNWEKWTNRIITLATALAVAVQYIISHWTAANP
jgi:hypothetical protein